MAQSGHRPHKFLQRWFQICRSPQRRRERLTYANSLGAEPLRIDCPPCCKQCDVGAQPFARIESNIQFVVDSL